MRGIILREVRERKEKRNKLIVGLVLVGIMILSTAGYAFYHVGSEEVEKIEYKGIEFVLMEDGLWHFNIEGQEFSTAYTPEEAEDVFSQANINLQNFVNKPLYFSYDSDVRGINEVVRNIGRFVARMQKVCIDRCEEDLPVKSCNNDNIIDIKEVNETLIKQEENCIYILAREDEIVKASDAFVFKVLGII